ncbi:esterase-like activity of phytase family protein [uncultured Paracoccus sp.]|uniref:esterase-like activity of phytase family protein n=1 Tax=uncultured Paracoccus sp. TaxID=189685 RepID=UPI0025FB2511|nr:esterase-like activity of phytase family protein [uncultured Paracoccus sp.]
MTIRALTTTSILALCASGAWAEPVFNRIASFPVTANMAEGEDKTRESSAEIISASADGMTLVYTDSPLGVLGFVDITDPAAPKPLGNLPLDGEPTTAHIIGDRVFVGVNTSDSKAQPSGRLAVADLASRAEVASCDLGGQPDSVAVAPDGSFLAVAIENERDEDVNDGAMPQAPAGFVVILPLTDDGVDCAAKQTVDVTGIADIVPEDPEPEFVDINEAGDIAVTLQENNHVIILARDGSVKSHFSAGEVALDGVDTATDGRLDFTGSAEAKPREPDGIKWLDANHVAIANEGDWKGGTRGFSIFATDGTLVFDTGTDLEHAIAALGHYPEGRSKSKGVEIESIETAVFDGKPYLFAVSERGSVIAVYDATDPAAPRLTQILPSGISPEGIVAIPERNLLVSANEADLGKDGGARAHVMLFELAEGEAAYPTLTSEGTDPLIGWGALGALAADPETPGHLFAASDSAYDMMPSIYRIDATAKPARITGQILVTRGGQAAQKLDIEGLTTDGEGGFWLANEGDAAKLVPHAILHVDAEGEIQDEISLPADLLAHQTRFGAEGIAKVGNMLWIAMQREWGDDPKGQVKLLAYDLESEEWGAVRYPLEPKGEGWVGLSELAVHGDWLYVLERDNQLGEAAKVKKIFRTRLSDLQPAALGGDLPLVAKEEFRDLLPDLAQGNGYILDKVEGLTFDAAGEGFVVTDNDGVDDSSGETLFWSIGKVE